MVAELPEDPEAPVRAWLALGSPCASVYVPAFPPSVPSALGAPVTWARFARLRDRVEADADALPAIRAVLGPVEAELWSDADAVVGDPTQRSTFAASAWAAVDDALTRLGV
jgi:hypothetical protein